MFYFISFLLISGAMLLVLGLREAQQEAPERAVTRLTRLRERREALIMDESGEEEEIDREFVRREEQRATVRATTFLPSLSKYITSFSLLARLEQDLIQARSSWRASELLAASVMLSLVAFILLSFMGLGLLSLPLALCGLFMPWSYVKMLRAKYYRRFDEQLADTLMLMANSLKAGFSFLQAMEVVSREAQPPVSHEFSRVSQEIAVGVTIEESLNNLTQRVNSMDLNLMVTAVLIQREIGGSLAEILETISSVIRQRMSIKREIRVLTTQGRATGALLGFLPVGLGGLLHLVTKVQAPLEPSFIEPLFSDPRGQMMLGMAIAAQMLGFAVIMKIVSIRV